MIRLAVCVSWIFAFWIAWGSDALGEEEKFDSIVVGGLVYDGSGAPPIDASIGIRGDRIAFVGDADSITWTADEIIDASDHFVSPGFIDPHTHSLFDLLHPIRRSNVNYLTQGVTTVFEGNDGGGTPFIAKLSQKLSDQGIGTNVAFFVGHGSVRRNVMGLSARAPTNEELEEMKALVEQGMREGALGLSTGLYYTPGNYSTTDEVVALTTVIAPFGGIYESHIRDESSYQMGFLAALEEALDVGRLAGVPVHVGHIKALGVDVWGDSTAAIAMIEEAQAAGYTVTADQYPWTASGTHLRNAVMPRWALADSEQQYQARLRDTSLREEILVAVRDNIRRRGGATALLMATCEDSRFVRKTLADAATILRLDAAEAAIELLKLGSSRVISFNMNDGDIEAFMRQPWVMTSSDGNERHPRKYASFPRKYEEYVQKRGLMTIEEFIRKSTSLTAQTFRLNKRGMLKVGYYADIIVVDPENYRANATYLHWNRLSSGVRDVLVNGQLAIRKHRVVQDRFAGRVLSPLKGANTDLARQTGFKRPFP